MKDPVTYQILVIRKGSDLVDLGAARRTVSVPFAHHRDSPTADVLQREAQSAIISILRLPDKKP